MGDIDKEIDFLFDYIDCLARMNKFELIDTMLQYAMVEQMDLTIVCAYASITLNMRHKLPSRKQFMKRFTDRAPERPGLWRGLE